jgi:hypothetical protein
VVTLTPAGTVTDFRSSDPVYSCLDRATLNVFWNVIGVFWNAIGHAAVEAVTPANCTTQDFELPD